MPCQPGVYRRHATPCLEWLRFSSGSSQGIQLDDAAVPAGIASDGSGYLIVDADAQTSNATALSLTAAGELLGRHALGVRFNKTDAALVWTGSDYAALSRANFNDAPQATLRLTRSGESIAPPPANQEALAAGALASNGRDIFAVWNGGASTAAASILAERLDPSTLTAAAPTLVSISASTQTSPSMAFSAINYAVAWNEGSRSWLRRFSLTGEPLDPMPIPLVDTVVRDARFAPPRVIFDGRSYVAAAVADNATGFLALRIRITRVDASTGRTTGSFDGPHTDPDGTFDLRSDGVNTVLAWTYGPLHAAHVGETSLLDANTVTPPDMGVAAPSLAWNGAEWLLAFHQIISLPNDSLESDTDYPHVRRAALPGVGGS